MDKIAHWLVWPKGPLGPGGSAGIVRDERNIAAARRRGDIVEGPFVRLDDYRAEMRQIHDVVTGDDSATAKIRAVRVLVNQALSGP